MASKRAIQLHVSRLRKLMKDPRLSPDRSFLVQMLLMHLEDLLPLDFILAVYSKAKMTAVDLKESGINPNTSHQLKANTTIKETLNKMLMEEQGDANTTGIE